jgi:hypothetical protein
VAKNGKVFRDIKYFYVSLFVRDSTSSFLKIEILNCSSSQNGLEKKENGL